MITSSGEVKAVLQDIKSYEEMQQSLVLLKILTQSTQSLQRKRFKPIKKAFTKLRFLLNSFSP